MFIANEYFGYTLASYYVFQTSTKHKIREHPWWVLSYGFYTAIDMGVMRLVATYAGILENLGESGVDVDGRGDVVDGGIELHVGGDLLDDVG